MVSLLKIFNYLYFVAAGTPGFTDQWQIVNGEGYKDFNLFYFLFCDWKTSWALLYQPINDEQRKKIDEIVEVRIYNLSFCD